MPESFPRQQDYLWSEDDRIFVSHEGRGLPMGTKHLTGKNDQIHHEALFLKEQKG